MKLSHLYNNFGGFNPHHPTIHHQTGHCSRYRGRLHHSGGRRSRCWGRPEPGRPICRWLRWHHWFIKNKKIGDTHLYHLLDIIWYDDNSNRDVMMVETRWFIYQEAWCSWYHRVPNRLGHLVSPQSRPWNDLDGVFAYSNSIRTLAACKYLLNKDPLYISSLTPKQSRNRMHPILP